MDVNYFIEVIRIAPLLFLFGIPALSIAAFHVMNLFFSERKVSRKIEFLVYACLPISAILVIFLGVPNSLLFNGIRNLSFYLIFSGLYKGSKIKKISAVLTLFLLMSFSDVVGLFIFFMEGSLMQGFWIINYEWVNIIALLFIYLSPFSLRTLSFIKKDEEVPRETWIVLIVSIIISNMAFLVLGIFDLEFHIHLILLLSIFVMVVVVFFILEKFTLAHIQQQAAFMEAQEKLHYQTQYQLIQENFENSRDMRHDFKLHLNTLEEQLRVSPEEAQKYVVQLLEQSKKNVIHSNTGHVIFDAVINGELGKITNNAIAVEIDIKIPIDLKIDAIDVTKILGNLLTNAITATTAVENPFINLNICYSKGQLLIVLENSFDGVVIYEKDQIISRHVDGENRGRGLKIIRKAVQQYDGEMKIIHNEDKFTVKLVIYM